MSQEKRYSVEQQAMQLHLPGHRLGTEERLVVGASGFDVLRDTYKASLAREAALRKQLDDATTSLETISQMAGRDENMKHMSQVRGYANSRATVARNFLIQSVGVMPHE